jgi:glycolate oxidase FAD binding subunit
MPGALAGAGAAAVHGATQTFGGHATLIRAPSAIRASVDVFPPQAVGVAAIGRRVKEGFDPRGILNPGRMHAGL